MKNSRSAQNQKHTLESLISLIKIYNISDTEFSRRTIH